MLDSFHNNGLSIRKRHCVSLSNNDLDDLND